MGCTRLRFGIWRNYHSTSLCRLDDSSPTKMATTLKKLGIELMHQSADTPGKNSSDIKLIIDSMDILHDKKPNILILVSSDSDFTQLVYRFKQSNIIVHGIGESKAPQSFIKSCNDFIYTENIDKKIKASTRFKTEISILTNAINKIWESNEKKNNTWVELNKVSPLLKKSYPNFNPEKYGCDGTRHFIEEYANAKFDVDNLIISNNKARNDYYKPKSLQTPKLKKSHPKVTQETSTKKLPLCDIAVELKTAWGKYKKEDGWAHLGPAIKFLKRSYPNFNATEYGCRTAREFIKTHLNKDFDIENFTIGNNQTPNAYYRPIK